MNWVHRTMDSISLWHVDYLIHHNLLTSRMQEMLFTRNATAFPSVRFYFSSVYLFFISFLMWLYTPVSVTKHPLRLRSMNVNKIFFSWQHDIHKDFLRFPANWNETTKLPNKRQHFSIWKKTEHFNLVSFI